MIFGWTGVYMQTSREDSPSSSKMLIDAISKAKDLKILKMYA